MVFKRIFLTIYIILPFFFAEAREVSSQADEIRIQGYQDYLETNDRLEKKRNSDIQQLKEWREAWSQIQKKALEKYKIEKSKQAATLDEASPEYREYIMSKIREHEAAEWARSHYVEKRNKKRLENRRQVQLSEEQELALLPETDRVEWKKRTLFGAKLAGSGRSSKSGGDFSSPPPPPPSSFPPSSSPPEFYEPLDEIPPPPVEPGFFDDGGAPPPPPPPLFDEM
ncbi:MAG: hypothetical protein BroJett040_11810 [Oligoflexia bacterium]|nr:MAG: hypothetical protein BroJett040_11810 [Oligoflexia bacterium]